MKQRTTRMEPREVVVSTTCDNCGKQVNGNTPDDWLSFWSSHDDWGNDSIESRNPHDACSAACFLQIAQWLADEYGDDPAPTLKLELEDIKLPFLRGLLDLAGESGTE